MFKFTLTLKQCLLNTKVFHKFSTHRSHPLRKPFHNTKDMQYIVSLFLTKLNQVKIRHPLLALSIFFLARFTGNEAKDCARMREERSQCEYWVTESMRDRGQVKTGHVC